MDKYSLGNFLAQLRNEKGLTQEQLSEMINVNYKTISKWECGNSSPSLDTLVQLCEVYNVSLYEMSIYKRISNPLISKNNIKKIINKKSIMKYIVAKIIIIIFLILLIIFTTYSSIYTINNYNQIKIYELQTDNNPIQFNGLFVTAYDKYYLSISNITYSDIEDEFINNSTKLLKYSLIINNETVENGNIEFEKKTKIRDAISSINIYISNQKLTNNINSLDLKINYATNNGKEEIKTFKVNLSHKKQNNKLFY